MPEPELVRGSSTRTEADRGLAGRLQHRAAAQLLGVPDARRICGGQWPWKRRWLRHLGKRYAFPTFPQPRRRRPYFDRCNGTKNSGSFVMTGPKTGCRSHVTKTRLRSFTQTAETTRRTSGVFSVAKPDAFSALWIYLHGTS